MPAEEILIFGGTFDPPHIGHLVVADELFCKFKPVAVTFVPAAHAPHKAEGPYASAADRLEMLRLATGQDSRFIVSGVEVERGGISYTVDTVAYFRAQGYEKIIVAVGADNVADITSWKDWRTLLNEVRVVAFTRPGYDVTSAPEAVREKLEIVEVTPIAVSSTLVRRRVRAGEAFRYLVPPGVYEYINERRLYR